MSLTRGMFGDPLVSHAICRFPDGRYALTETTGGDCVMIGEPIEISEAMNLARSILDGDQVIARAPVAVHSVALMLLALIGEGAKRQAAGGAYGSL